MQFLYGPIAGHIRWKGVLYGPDQPEERHFLPADLVEKDVRYLLQSGMVRQVLPPEVRVVQATVPEIDLRTAANPASAGAAEAAPNQPPVVDVDSAPGVSTPPAAPAAPRATTVLPKPSRPRK